MNDRIFRPKHASGEFFIMHKRAISDPNLSWEAKGVLAYLMSKPPDWECYNYDLERHSKNSLYSIKKIVSELQQAGHIRRFVESNGRGGIRNVTEVYELPECNPDFVGRITSNDNTSNDNTSNDNTSDDNTSDDRSTGTNNKPTKNNPPKNKSNNTHPPNGRGGAVPTKLKKLFDSMGINPKKQKELSEMGWITPEYVTAHIEIAKKEKIATGLLVYRLSNNYPVPSEPEPGRVQIPSEYEGIIKR